MYKSYRLDLSVAQTISTCMSKTNARKWMKDSLDSVLIMSKGGDVSIRPYNWAYWVPMRAAD